VPNAAVAGCLLTWTSRRSRHCQDWLAWGFREDLCVFTDGFRYSLWPQPCWLGRWCWYPGLCRRPRVAEWVCREANSPGGPDRGGRDRVAEPDQLSLHPPVPPGGVLRRDADHELLDRGRRGRPPGTPTARVIPLARDQPPVPGEQRRRCHHEHLAPPAPGDQSRQRRQPQPAGWPVTDSADLAAQHGFSCHTTRSSASLAACRRVSTVRQPSMQPTSG
jgi:hypothetical protein